MFPSTRFLGNGEEDGEVQGKKGVDGPKNDVTL